MLNFFVVNRDKQVVCKATGRKIYQEDLRNMCAEAQQEFSRVVQAMLREHGDHD
jgi:hypothetical protein